MMVLLEQKASGKKSDVSGGKSDYSVGSKRRTEPDMTS